ncbi:MAG: GatB/YqeY domain-containing protein [Gemmatimonadota bacterium]|nr:GatB/YqeY domain-containing protein [Gemmatimonadota bacterium]
MNETRERIDADLKAAMKEGDKVRVSTLRMVSSELQNARIEKGEDLEEDEIVAVLAKAKKQRAESEEQYREAGRDDLADREAAEAAIIGEYLPEPIPDEELDELIDAAIAETGATSMNEMGAVMGRVMSEVRGRVEGSEVSRRVRERLSR